MNSTRKVISIFLVACLIANSVSNSAYAATNTTSYPPQCEDVNPANLRTELSNIIQTTFAEKQIAINIENSVNKQWENLSLDEAIDSEIDKAVEIESSNTDLGEKFRSNWSKDVIQGMTNRIAELAFDAPSSEVKKKIDILSKNVAKGLSVELENASVSSSEQAMNCIKRFVDRRYSQTVWNMFDRHLTSLSRSINTSQDYRRNAPEPIEAYKDNLTGLGVIIAIIGRQAIKKGIAPITERISFNVVQRIFGRLTFLEIPFFGEIIASVLTIWDVVEGFNGALPIIQKKLKEPELKIEVRQTIITTFKSELQKESSQISDAIANAIYPIWIEFTSNYKQTLDVAEGSPKFRNILDNTNEQTREKLFSLVGKILAVTGRNQLIGYIEDGTFERLLSLPESTYQMLTNGDSIPILIDWVDLAGNRIDEVIKTELYKHLSPKNLTRQMLIDILSIQDLDAINKLALLDASHIQKLLTVSKSNLIALANRLSPNNLQLIAGYLDGLEQINVNRIVKFLLDEPMPGANVISHIVKSRDIDTAIQFWKHPSLLKGIISSVIGDISWQLITSKYSLLILLPIAVFAFPILLLLLAIAFLYYRPKKVQDLQQTTEY